MKSLVKNTTAARRLDLCIRMPPQDLQRERELKEFLNQSAADGNLGLDSNVPGCSAIVSPAILCALSQCPRTNKSLHMGPGLCLLTPPPTQTCFTYYVTFKLILVPPSILGAPSGKGPALHDKAKL